MFVSFNFVFFNFKFLIFYCIEINFKFVVDNEFIKFDVFRKVGFSLVNGDVFDLFFCVVNMF